jgi:hypothetical protein
VAAAWLGALVIVAGVAVMGGQNGDATREVASRPSATDQGPAQAAVQAATAGATATTTQAPPERVIVLRDPPMDDALVTTHDLVVSGYLTSGMGPVRVGLASRNGKALAFRTVEPTVIGRVNGDSSPSFLVALPLVGPRDGSPMTIQVIAYDRHGIPLDVIRREVILGPVTRRVVGADGLLGGIAIGTPMSERGAP